MSSDWSTEGPDFGSSSEAPNISAEFNDTRGHEAASPSSGYNMSEHSDIIEKAN